MSSLDRLQREFFRALLLPLRGSSRDSTDLAATGEGHSPEFFRIADELIRPGPALTSAERLELYHRQYWFRLLDSLAEDFPVMRRMAGESLFWQLIEGYLLARPSRSFTLRHLGEGFSGFIESSDMASPEQRLWLHSVARIEYACMKAFECSQYAIPQPEDLENQSIILQDHVQILRLPVPADLCWEWERFTPTPPREVHVAVWRGSGGRSHHERLETAEVPLLETLREGTRLAALFDALPDPCPSEEDITRWFTKWQSHRWLGIPGQQGSHTLDHNGGWHGIDRMSSQAVRMG